MAQSFHTKTEKELRFAVETCLREAGKLVPPANSSSSEKSLVVGVSGGEDSHALLHVLHGLARKLGVKIIVAHVDHGLRAESASEAEIVRQLAKDYGAEFKLFQAGPRDPGENVEAWGRRIRYSYFDTVRRETGSWLTLTAHHQNDQAETVLFRLLSGRALTSGRAISEFDVRQNIARPFLRVSKKKIKDYVKAERLSAVLDGSNLDTARTRNRIRLELLPVLEAEYNPNVVEDLFLFAERFGNDDEFLWNHARGVAETLAYPIPLAQLRAVPPSLQWRILAVKAEEVFGEDGFRVGYHAYRGVLGRVLEECLDGPKKIELGFGYSAIIHPTKGVEFGLFD